MKLQKLSKIIWHDLFSSDRQRSADFYRRIAGWHFETEHSTDFAWGGGEKDFILALLDGEAGAGIAETPDTLQDGWVPYIEVLDVDTAVANAERLGGLVVREPFEVPGVGRNALVEDPLGSLTGLALSRHDYPAPTRQFGPEVYLSSASDFPTEFYSRMFDWTVRKDTARAQTDAVIHKASGEVVAKHVQGEVPNSKAMWVPNLKVNNPQNALSLVETLEAETIRATALGEGYTLVRDPCGAFACLKVKS